MLLEEYTISPGVKTTSPPYFSTTPNSSCDVIYGDRIVGTVTAGVPSPTLGLGIGYVKFKTPGDWAGKEMKLRFSDGKEYNCSIVGLPFFDKDHLIVRGIDRKIP